MQSRPKNYISYRTKDVQKMLDVLNNPMNPDAVTLTKKYYQPILKLKENEIMEIIDIYELFIEYNISKVHVFAFMNEVENKFGNEDKTIRFNKRDRPNKWLISGFINSFCIDHPQEMLEMICELIIKHSQNQNENEIRNKIKNKIDQIHPAFPESTTEKENYTILPPRCNEHLYQNSTNKNISVEINDNISYDDYFDNEFFDNLEVYYQDNDKNDILEYYF